MLLGTLSLGGGDTKAFEAWGSPDEFDHLLKLDSAELGQDLFNASFMKQQKQLR
jgi:hypothetical protein